MTVAMKLCDDSEFQLRVPAATRVVFGCTMAGFNGFNLHPSTYPFRSRVPPHHINKPLDEYQMLTGARFLLSIRFLLSSHLTPPPVPLLSPLARRTCRA